VESWVEAETIDENERRAREEIRQLVIDGYAQDLMNTWSYCSQSCNYVYSILHDVANAEFGTVSGDVRNFARNLLDDWSK